jgi:Fe-S oxidoreductase
MTASATRDQVTPTDAPKASDFAYPEFYRAMLERERMQVARDEAKWIERHTPPERQVDVVLNFGCNVRQTPHLMREAVAVFEALGIDHVALAGQQFCCGKPYAASGLDDVARHVADASVKRMSSFKPKVEIQWCSACEMQFQDLVIPELGIEFESMGLAAFLTRRLDELGDRVPWKRPVPLRALVHGHLGQHRVRDAHPGLTMELLRRVPGVELAEETVASSPALDICDNSGIKIASIDSRQFRAAQASLEEYVASEGADTLVTLYHNCTRELSKFASERVRIRHYISIVAEALGVGKPDRFSQYWRLGDPERVKEASRPNWESWGYTDDEARALAHKYFVPSYAADAPECPCNGACTRTGASWLWFPKVDRAKQLPMAQ